MKFDHTIFFNMYRGTYNHLNQTQVDGLESLLNSIEQDSNITDLRYAAYMLATIKHECADTYQPITERGKVDYFSKYDAGTAIGKRLGNTEPGDGYRFRGRGYVQITGRANYQNMTRLLGLSGSDDLVANPERALDPVIAYRIMSYGMCHGSFTGRKLAQYINENGCDYKDARQIINGHDQWEKIKGYAEAFESILQGSQTA